MRSLLFLLFAAALVLSAACTSDDPNQDVHLYHAVANEDIERVRELIEAGADVNLRQRPWNLTPLLLAAERDPALAPLLVKAGADINAADRERQTVFMKAVHIGNTEVVRFLLEQPDLDLEARAGLQDNTALTYAVLWGRPDIAKLIIDAGADVNVVRVNGTTPLSIARHMLRLAHEMPEDGSEAQTVAGAADGEGHGEGHAAHPAPGATADEVDPDAKYAHKGHDEHGHRLRDRADAVREHGLVLTLLQDAGAKAQGDGNAPGAQHHH